MHPATAVQPSQGHGSSVGSGAVSERGQFAIIELGQAAVDWGEYCRRGKAGQRPGRRVGFPRFKRRKHEQGFRGDNGPNTVKVESKVVTLPKIGRVAVVEELRFADSVREVTVNRTAGMWLASFRFKDGLTIAVDVGVGTVATCSDGSTVENPKAWLPA